MQGNLFEGFPTKVRKKKEVGLKEARLLKCASAIVKEVKKQSSDLQEQEQIALDFTIRMYRKNSKTQQELLDLVLTRLNK
jgi:hypothetical protein